MYRVAARPVWRHLGGPLLRAMTPSWWRLVPAAVCGGWQVAEQTAWPGSPSPRARADALALAGDDKIGWPRSARLVERVGVHAEGAEGGAGVEAFGFAVACAVGDEERHQVFFAW